MNLPNPLNEIQKTPLQVLIGLFWLGTLGTAILHLTLTLALGRLYFIVTNAPQSLADGISAMLFLTVTTPLVVAFGCYYCLKYLRRKSWAVPASLVGHGLVVAVFVVFALFSLWPRTETPDSELVRDENTTLTRTESVPGGETKTTDIRRLPDGMLKVKVTRRLPDGTVKVTVTHSRKAEK